IQLAVKAVAWIAPLAYFHSPEIRKPPSRISAVPVAAPLPARQTFGSEKSFADRYLSRNPANHPAPLHSVTTHAVLPSAHASASSRRSIPGSVKPDPFKPIGTNILNQLCS